MATNLAIDRALLDRAVEISGERSKKAVVTKALQELIARREQCRVVEVMGKLAWDDSFNVKAERSRCAQAASTATKRRVSPAAARSAPRFSPSWR
jgi:Bacterial antitoxin of type II TA system, VapB